MRILIKNFILLFAISYALYAGVVMAQFDLPTNQLPNLNMKPTLSLTVDTRTPLPGAVIIATANLSGITNVNNSNYTWFLNNIRQKEASGSNKNIFTFQVNNLGAVYKVSVSILTPNGDNLSDSISLTVSDFDLTWSASSQAPASYKGKLLPTQNSTVGLSALPFIYQPGTKTLINNNNLIFNWRVDDKLSAGNSGIGKSDFIFKVNDYAGADKSIRLEIKTSDNMVSLSKSLTIPIARPQTLIYFADSKTNLPFGIALKNVAIKPPTNLDFIAQNYFFNAPSKDLKWQWFINNEEVIGKGEKPWLASLNLSNIGQLFSTRVQVLAKNPANDLETAQSTINLEVR
ncbi:MAG: hypothetical protein NTV77_00725 [Candidatus Azambacteria bacterium]|nr:hypothetical protein [Candidatus Azambacteria bacterium]